MGNVSDLRNAAIPREHEFLFFFRCKGVIGGGDLKDRPVFTLQWIGRREPDTAHCVQCHEVVQTRTGHCPFWIWWHGECV